MNLINKILSALAIGSLGGGTIIGYMVMNKNSKRENPTTIDLKSSNFVVEEKEIFSNPKLGTKITSDLKSEDNEEERNEFSHPSIELKEDEIKKNSLNRQTLTKSQLEEQEIQDRQILLETVWVYEVAGIDSSQKSCTLLTRNSNEKGVPNIIEAVDERDENCSDINTIWSENDKQLNDRKEVLWIRGETKETKDLIYKNWDDLTKNFNFVEKNKKVPKFSSEISEDFDELNKQFCKINKNNRKWIEIICQKN